MRKSWIGVLSVIAVVISSSFAEEGILPPNITVTPDSLSDSLAVGETSALTITIGNTGDSDLSFEISTQEIDASAVSLNLSSVKINKLLNKRSREGRIGFYADESREISATLPTTLNTQSLLSNSVQDLGDILNEYTGFPFGNVGIVWVEEELYVVDFILEKLVKFDITTGTITDVFPLHFNPYGIIWDGQYFWIGSSNGNVYGYDLDGNAVGSFSSPFFGFTALAWNGFEFIVYPAFDFRSVFYKVDVTGTIIETFNLAFDAIPYQMVWVEEHSSLWVYDWLIGKIRRVSLENGEAVLLDEFNFFDDNFAYSITHDGTDLWWSDWEGPLYQIDDGIQEGVVWISVFPDTGTISAASSVDITITFDSARLFGGDYDAEIVISSNDALQPEVIVHSHLTVTGAPDIDIPDNVLVFGEAFVGFPSTMPLTIFNEGTDTLKITNVTSDNPDFSPETISVSIPARTTHDLQISLTPSAEGFTFGILTIESNDSDEDSIEIALLGEGVPSPDIEFSVDSLSADLFTGEADTQTVTITNIGGGELVFNLSLDLIIDTSSTAAVVSETDNGIYSKLGFNKNETEKSITDFLTKDAGVKSSSVIAYSDALNRWSEIPTGMVFRKNNTNSASNASLILNAYVANAFNNTVSVIDVATNEIIGDPISVGSFPWRLAISPSSEQVWVSNRDSDNISVIEASSLTVIETISVGNGPTGIVFSPDGRKAYVANRWSNSVMVINTSTFEIESTITSSINSPQDLAITPDGKFLYVLNLSQGVTVIETSTNSFITNIALPTASSTHTIKISPDGSMLYLTYFGVAVIDVETNSVIADITGFSNPHGLDFTPDGKFVYVADKFNGAVKVIETTGHTVVSTISDARIFNSWGLAIERDGNFAYVTNPSGSTDNLLIIDIATNTALKSISMGSGLRGLATFRPFFPIWLDAEPKAGIVAPDSSIDIKVTFDAQDLFGGNYFADVTIASNDPREVGGTKIPVHLIVTGAPDISLSTDTLDFSEVFIGYGDTLSLTVSNDGTDSLTVTDIISSLGEFTVTPTSFLLLPSEKQAVAVTALPTTTGSLSGTLSIISDDPDEPTLLVTVLSEALIPPVISVFPDSLNDHLISGQSSAQVMTIQNNGGSDLRFFLSTRNVDPPTIIIASSPLLSSAQRENQRNKQIKSKLRVNKKERNSADLPISGIRVNKYNNHKSRELAGRHYNTSSSKSLDKVNSISTNIRQIPKLRRGSDTNINPVRRDLNVLWQTPAIKDRRTGLSESKRNLNSIASSAGLLQEIISDPLGDASFVDVIAVNGGVSNGELTLQIVVDGTIDPYDFGGALSLDVDRDSTTGNPPLFGNSFQNIGAEYDLTWFDGDSIFLFDQFANFLGAFERVNDTDRSTVTIPLSFLGDDDGEMDISGVLGNFNQPTDWVPDVGHGTLIPGARWVSFDTSFVVLPVDSSIDIMVTFDSEGLFGGDYYAEIVIESNDPESSRKEMFLPLHLGVTGVPDIFTERTAVDFGNIFTGYEFIEDLLIVNEGTDSLFIESITTNVSQLTIGQFEMLLLPGEEDVIELAILSSSVGSISGTLTIASNDPDEGEYVIAIAAEIVNPPVADISIDSVRVEVKVGTFEFNVFMIDNSGESDLLFSIDAVELETADIIELRPHSQLTFQSILSDVWGYSSPSGIELAIVGQFTGTAFVDVTTNPTVPIVVAEISGPGSIWRDIKTYGHYAYIVNENGGGMQIVDMSDPENPFLTSVYTATFSSAHNIFIDDAGFAYVVGSNLSGGGLHILDLSADPENPVYVGEWSNAYIHDVYVRGDTAYAASLGNGLIFIDITDRTSPITIQTFNYASSFTHNVWLNEDGNYALTTDEVIGGYLKIWDIQDLNNIFLVSEYRTDPNHVPHNVIVENDVAYLSSYVDGLIVLDISDPTSISFIDSIDTSPFSGSFDGAWGVYPFAKGGLVFVSDRQTGLHVFNSTLDWLKVGPSSGVIQPNENQEITLVLDARDLSLGEYEGDVIISTNDPINPDKTVPVLIEVKTVVGINQDNLLPNEFVLEQNYPNPFNPVTTINYALPSTSSLTLVIYNLMGQEVMRWEETDVSPGFYSKLWNGTNKAGIQVSTGIYIYKLIAGDFTKTKKMVLLK